MSSTNVRRGAETEREVVTWGSYVWRGTAQTSVARPVGLTCQVTRGPGAGPLALTCSVTYQNLPHRQLPRCLLLPTVHPKPAVGSPRKGCVGEQRVNRTAESAVAPHPGDVGSPATAQFGENVANVGFDGALGQEELFGDATVAQTLDHLGGDRSFTRRQTVEFVE